jgi:hypothetical protein
MIRSIYFWFCLVTVPLAAQQPDSTAITITHPPDSFPSLALLLASVDSFHAQRCTALLAEFQSTTRGAWMDWMPTIGVGYVPSLSPDARDRLRPSVGYSLANVKSALDKRDQLAAKRLAIAGQCALEAQRERELVWEMYGRRVLLLEQLAQQKALIVIDRQLFEYYASEFKEVRIPAAQYLTEKQQLMQKEFEIIKAETQVKILEGVIMRDAHYK